MLFSQKSTAMQPSYAGSQTEQRILHPNGPLWKIDTQAIRASYVFV